jgi:anti-sigma regulatory factor (Ser/Thr protein kinase)
MEHFKNSLSIITNSYIVYTRHMEPLQLQFPKQATITYIDTFLKWVREIRGADAGTKIVFDLSATTELSSIFICFICGLIDLAKQGECQVKIKMPKEPSTRRVLRAVKKIVPKAGRPTLLLAESLCQMRKITSNNSAPIQDVVMLIGHKTRMSRQLKEDARLLLTELLTNAIDHSGTGACYICAGKWGKKSKFVHFTILDFGVGIPTTLKKVYEFDTDEIALTNLLERGLTSRQGREGGKGYRYVQDIMRRTSGRFYIYSGDAKVAYRYDRGEYESKEARKRFSGTCVNLAFNLDHNEPDEETKDAREEFF